MKGETLKTPAENKVLNVDANKDGAILVSVRLLSNDAMEGKLAGDVVFVDMATAERLIAGYFAEMAEE